MNNAGQILTMQRSGASPLERGIPVETVSADPRTAGLARAVGTTVTDGTNYFQKLATGDSDWVRLGIDKSTVSGAAVTTLDFTGLDGDKDGGYELEGYVNNSAGADIFIELQPNAAATSMKYRFLESLNVTSVLGGTDTTKGILVNVLQNAKVGHLVARITSRTGRRRFFECVWTTGPDGTNALVGGVNWGFFDDTATNITSLRVSASSANGLGIGSRFTLRRLGAPLL